MSKVNALKVILGCLIISVCIAMICYVNQISLYYSFIGLFLMMNAIILFHFKKKYSKVEETSTDKLRHMAYHDPLTGLANRNSLEQHINRLILTSQNRESGFALIILDLDYFKNINDSLGHDVGDSILKIVAERLRNTVRSNDMVARIGGDEFIIVISDTSNNEIVGQIAQKILNSMLKATTVKNHEIYITTSIGISIYPHDGNDIETLMKNSDMALYRAKEQGRNNYQFCTADMTHKAQQKAARQTAMTHGLVKEEFILYYQPSVDMVTQDIISVEALLRWQSKDYGLVTPDSIISIAEESGLIVPLSEWILRTACKQVKLWQEMGYKKLRLAINLSPRHFKEANFIEGINSTLKETGLDPSFLELEIKESLIMHDPENAHKILEKLKSIGIQLVIDDFGTGFSSFTYLANNAVDKIKIDKTFIHQLSENPKKSAPVSAMILMAKKLGIKIVAEGVETKEQFDILMKEGCDEVQGYYIAKPLPTDLIESFLSIRTINSSTEVRR